MSEAGYPDVPLNLYVCLFVVFFLLSIGGAVAQWVECVTPGEEVLGSIPAPAPYWLIRCQYNVTVRELSGVSLGTRLRYSLVSDADVKKPTKETKKMLTTVS